MSFFSFSQPFKKMFNYGQLQVIFSMCFYLFIFYFFGWDWGLNSVLSACKAAEPHLQSILL
jgi:hypothetical protein